MNYSTNIYDYMLRSIYNIYSNPFSFSLPCRILIIDDLVATGGTLSAGIQCVKMLEGIVVECACVVELKMFIDPPEGSGLPNRTKMFEECGMGDVPVWGLISEDILTEEAALPEGYVDDGEEH